jgi:hypothetical protein
MWVPAYTDYPIRAFGDQPHVEAPVRPCQVLSWDRDKYVQIRAADLVFSVKRWYVYGAPGRSGEVPALSEDELAALPAEVTDSDIVYL